MKFFRWSLPLLAIALFAEGLASTNAVAAEKAASSHSVPVSDNLKDIFVELAHRVVPSVVNIYTTQVITSPYDGNSPQAELYRRFFENFFGEDVMPDMPRSQKATSLGTGFIIDDKEGLVLTNYHVIADADEIKVILTEAEADQEGIEATVAGGDAEADVALLKIKTKRKLQAVTLGDSDAMQVGEWVMAVGNPFGHGHTVTHGIISAKERIIPISQYANYIQTDAPINPGNSGGPLINTAGQVIGINTAINAAAQGIGFAIPIDFVKRILPELRSKGAVTRGYIGVNITEITPPLAKSLKINPKVHGVLVSEVFEGEPAAKAGIKAYDVITEINGHKVGDGRQLVNAVSALTPGSTVPVKVLRDGKEKELKLLVGKRPGKETLAKKEGSGNNHKRPKFNLSMIVENIDPDSRRELGIPPNLNGVVVSRVSPGGPAEEAGLHRGDFIVEVDQKPTPDLASFYAIFQEKKVYLVRFRRGDNFAITSLDLIHSQGAPGDFHKGGPPDQDMDNEDNEG